MDIYRKIELFVKWFNEEFEDKDNIKPIIEEDDIDIIGDNYIRININGMEYSFFVYDEIIEYEDDDSFDKIYIYRNN
jgi:mRNA-degrading endonuclease HigB of HigAB toxin-antitoxin module